MPRDLKTILRKTTLNSIINAYPSIRNAYHKFEKEQINTLKYSKLEEIVIDNISVKKYIYTLVDDFKALVTMFWNYYRNLFRQSQGVVELATAMQRLDQQTKTIPDYRKIMMEKIKMDEMQNLTTMHAVIDNTPESELKPEEKKREKEKETAKMYKRIEKKEVELKKTIANDLRQITIARKQLNEDKEMLNEMADDLDDYYKEIAGQITLHMLKFSQNWNDKQSKKLFAALQLGKPKFGMRNGVNILIATTKLNDLQNILRLLTKLEEKAEELEEAHKAERMAQQLIADEEAHKAEQMAQQLIAEEESTKKKKKKKKKKTKKKKPTDKEKEPATPAQAPTAPPAKATAVQAKATTPPAKATLAPSAAAKKEDPFKLRIQDIQSYLNEKRINPKKEENPAFIEHKEVILEFIRELNKKMPTGYTLIITGGYAINLHGGNNKTSDVDMVLCHNSNVHTARGFVTSQIFELMGEKKMDVRVLQLAPGTDVNDPTNPVKIRINSVQAIDITFKNNTNNFCKEIELKGGFFVLKANFMKRNLMEITNDFRQKLAEGVISHPGKLVSWLHQMTSLNKLLNPRSRTSSPTQGGVRKTRRKKKIKKRKKSRKKK